MDGSNDYGGDSDDGGVPPPLRATALHVSLNLAGAVKAGDTYTGTATTTFCFVTDDDDDEGDNDADTSGAAAASQAWASNAAVLRLHCAGSVALQSARVTQGARRTVKVASIAREPNDVAAFVLVAPLSSAFGASDWELSVTFSATVQAKPEGVYAAVPPGAAPGGAAVLATQFEVSFARRAFPCVDDAASRQRFSLSLASLPPGTVCALANNVPCSSSSSSESAASVAPGAVLRAASFLATDVPIPLYVAGFFVSAAPVAVLGATVGGGDVVCSALTSDGALPMSAVTLRASRFPAAAALKTLGVAVRMLATFFGTPLPLRRLDLVAVPVLALGGMENHGLIFIQEAVGLGGARKGGGNAGGGSEEALVQLIVHEVAHMWIGNAVGTSFAVKEGVCQLLELCIGDAVLGKPMRKLAKPSGDACGSGTGTSTGTRANSHANGTANGAEAPSVTAAEKGRELTGHTYQVALAQLQALACAVGWPRFEAAMRRLAAPANHGRFLSDAEVFACFGPVE